MKPLPLGCIVVCLDKKPEGLRKGDGSHLWQGVAHLEGRRRSRPGRMGCLRLRDALLKHFEVLAVLCMHVEMCHRMPCLQPHKASSLDRGMGCLRLRNALFKHFEVLPALCMHTQMCRRMQIRSAKTG